MKRHSIRTKFKRDMLRPKVPIKNMYWEFHKGDNDNFPSVPHGHSLNGKYKLKLWSGEIYNVQTNRIEYQAKKKDMQLLRRYLGFNSFVEECREEYQNRNPAIVLPSLIGKSYVTRDKKVSRKAPKKTHSKKDRFIIKLSINKV